MPRSPAHRHRRPPPAKSGLPLQVLSRLPRRHIYLGLLTPPSRDAAAWDIKARVVYPMDGGTALITFDEDAGEFTIF